MQVPGGRSRMGSTGVFPLLVARTSRSHGELERGESKGIPGQVRSATRTKCTCMMFLPKKTTNTNLSHRDMYSTVP